MKPGYAWPIARLALAACMLFLVAEAALPQEPNARGSVLNVLSSVGATLLVAGLPMIIPRYRSLRVFSWLLLIASFVQLYARKDALLGPAVVVTQSAGPGLASASSAECAVAELIAKC